MGFRFPHPFNPAVTDGQERAALLKRIEEQERVLERLERTATDSLGRKDKRRFREHLDAARQQLDAARQALSPEERR